MMIRAWTEDGFEHHGRFWQLRVPQLRPRPLTKPHPFVIRSSASEASMVELARRRRPFMMNVQSNAVTRQRMDLYRATLREVGCDDAAIAEITARLGNMETVITKKSLGFHSAETLTPAASCEAIYKGALAALQDRDRRHAYVLKTPITLDISFKNYQAAEILSYLRAVQRTDSHSIRFVGKDMQEVSDFVAVLDTYNPDAAP